MAGGEAKRGDTSRYGAVTTRDVSRRVRVTNEGAITRGSTKRGIGVEPKTPRTSGVTRRLRRRVRLVLVSTNRFERSAIARGLVQGHCAITVVTGGDDVQDAIETIDEMEVALVDIDDRRCVALVAALLGARPQLPIVAWTSTTETSAVAVLRAAGARKLAVAAKTARISDVLEVIQSLIHG
jgi:hypothetical protein